MSETLPLAIRRHARSMSNFIAKHLGDFPEDVKEQAKRLVGETASLFPSPGRSSLYLEGPNIRLTMNDEDREPPNLYLFIDFYNERHRTRRSLSIRVTKSLVEWLTLLDDEDAWLATQQERLNNWRSFPGGVPDGELRRTSIERMERRIEQRNVDVNAYSTFHNTLRAFQYFHRERRLVACDTRGEPFLERILSPSDIHQIVDFLSEFDLDAAAEDQKNRYDQALRKWLDENPR